MFIYEFMGGLVETISGGEEEEQYDPHKHRKVEKPTSYMDTMIHLLKGSIGAGILAMPNAVNRTGIIVGAAGIAVIGIFATYTLHLLISCQYEICKRWKQGYIAYPKSMRLAIETGPPCMRWSSSYIGPFVNGVLIMWQLGLCCVYIVFVAQNVKQVCDFYGKVIQVRLHICFLLLPLIITNMVKDLKLLTPLSTISNLVTIMGLLLTFFYLIEDDVVIEREKLEVRNLQEVPIFIGITLFALEAVGVILALEYNMENPKEFIGFFGLLNIGMCVILILYMLVGVFGYLKYGNETKASITLNLPKHEKKAQAAKLIFALAIFLTFPLQNFVAYNIIWQKIQKKFTSKIRCWDYFTRLLLILIPWAIAVALPQLGPFISLFGAFCLSLLAIIFPGLMDLCIWYPDKFGVCKYKLVRDLLIILIGIFCLVSGCYTSVLEIIAEQNSQSE